MIDTPVTLLTAEKAVELGLIQAIKNKEPQITGIYSIGSDCKVDFHQRNFFFTTNNDEVILAKFADNYELFHFWELLGDEWEE